MRVVAVALALLMLVGLAWAASPSNAPDIPLTTFRVEAAEVHVAFSAFDKHNHPATVLSPADLIVLRDGRPIEEAVALERRNESPITATVMTDVSYSMSKAIPMARNSWQWMSTNLLRAGDHVAYFDFGAELTSVESHKQSEMHLTSFYDCLLKLITQIKHDDGGRQAIVLFSDGRDNDSLHSLQEVINLAVEHDIAVYAVSTWKFKINADDEVLEQLASTTGGRYFLVKDTKEMNRALQNIAQELRNGYEVVFRAGRAQSGLHRIAIQSTNRRLRFYHRVAYFQPNASGIQAVLMASER